MDRLETLSESLGYQFRKPALLESALTHSSMRGNKEPADYQRLEFLGDRVLGLVIAEMLYKRFPAENEGELARRHAALVQRDTLAGIAGALGIGDAMTISKSEEKSGGRANPGLLADACEAVLGAVFADGGLRPASRIVRRFWTPLMDETLTPPKDAKTALQEWAQGHGKGLPVYALVRSAGKAHQLEFEVSVTVTGEEPITGIGRSKRVAEQAAAAALLAKLAG